MQHVDIVPLQLDRFEAILDAKDYRRFTESMERGARCLRGHALWCVNSTPKGGGVAEMLSSLMGYLAGAGIDARWLVIEGDDEFFDVTKRIHNHLHGESGDGGPLGEEERRIYERSLSPSSKELRGLVDPGDVVILHDPQPAGLVAAAKATGATVVWRCHIGVDEPNSAVRGAWDFLRPFLQDADAAVFSRRAYVWGGLDGQRVEVIMPSIDALSPKNQALDPKDAAAILHEAGIVPNGPMRKAEFERQDGTRGAITRRAHMVEDEPVPASAPLVTQVSRWDRLKDPIGVLRGFAEHVAERTEAHLVLAGPRVEGVADDPEEAEVARDVERERDQLPGEVKARVHLASLPLDDEEENSAMVNALQRAADVVVQKSLAEGFGLTVAEAMWKGRPVVAADVGGIRDQIVHDESGLLVDPTDLETFGRAVTELLEDRERAERLGRAARDRIREEFLPTRHLRQYAELLLDLRS